MQEIIVLIGTFLGCISLAGVVVHILTRNSWQIIPNPGTTPLGPTAQCGEWVARRRQGRGWEYREATAEEIDGATAMIAIR